MKKLVSEVENVAEAERTTVRLRRHPPVEEAADSGRATRGNGGQSTPLPRFSRTNRSGQRSRLAQDPAAEETPARNRPEVRVAATRETLRSAARAFGFDLAATVAPYGGRPATAIARGEPQFPGGHWLTNLQAQRETPERAQAPSNAGRDSNSMSSPIDDSGSTTGVQDKTSHPLDVLPTKVPFHVTYGVRASVDDHLASMWGSPTALLSRISDRSPSAV